MWAWEVKLASTNRWYCLFSFMAFNAYICQSRIFRKVSKESIELDLWSWLMHSTDQNAEDTPTTNVHTVGKLVATFTDSKRTTKQHRARTCYHNRLNCLFVITIRLPPISTGQQSKPLDWFQLIDWTQETNYTAPLEIRGDEIQRKQYLHLANSMRLPKLQRKVNTSKMNEWDKCPSFLL